MRRHPAGSLQSKYVIQPRRVSDGFEFLGYHFKRRYGRVHVTPTSSNLRALRLKIVGRYLMGDALEDVCARIRNWARNFALWEDIDLHVSFKQREAARLFRTHQ